MLGCAAGYKYFAKSNLENDFFIAPAITSSMSSSLPAIEERKKAAQTGQSHLFAFWDQLDPQQQQILLNDVVLANCENIGRLYEQSTNQKDDWSALANRAQPPQAIRINDQESPLSEDEAREAGEQALREGKVGTILVAGGQGTRLGFDHPKGMYSIGPVSNASLFQILLEKILAVGKRHGANIPLYIMTSGATHAETEQYLRQQNYFGLAAEDVRLFCQGVMPAVDAATGKILLAEKGRVALNPDGHGGMLAALDRTSCLADFKRRGIEHLFYFQVDNPLVQIGDPFLLGHHILARSEMTTLAVAKRDPLERVGNLVQIDGHTQVIEYSDFPDEVANQKNFDGTLKFWAGSVAIHVFDAAFLDRTSRQANVLPYHVARKKVAFINEHGSRVEPSQPNAVKFERFIFDLLPLAERAIVVEGAAADWFAPVKNPPGDQRDSPDTCRAALLALHREWLSSVGVQIAPQTPIEISPLFALDAAELRQKIKPGTRFDEPTYLR
jgi:UDP-N-acetylglucosamine/UDP-N-acetylgalactosamine diphosphorylase